MKKFSGKVMAGVFAAAVMASAAFVTVSAADYSKDPNYGKPTTEAVEVKADAVTAAVKESEGKDEVVITVESNAGAKLGTEALAAIKDAGKPVVLANETYTVTIDPKNIKDGAKEIDLSMGIVVTAEETKISNNVTLPAGAVMVSPLANGDFGMTVEVKVPAKGLGADAKLYYVADDGKVSEVKDALKIEGDYAVITISHASSYVLSATPVKEGSPSTGVTLPIALVALAGGSVAVSAIVAKKRK